VREGSFVFLKQWRGVRFPVPDLLDNGGGGMPVERSG